MRHNIAASRLKVGGSLGFLLHLSAHVSMLCLFCFRTEWCSATCARGARGKRDGEEKSMHAFQECGIARARVSFQVCARVFVLKRKQQGEVCTTYNMGLGVMEPRADERQCMFTGTDAE